jgi:hypothetical protein
LLSVPLALQPVRNVQIFAGNGMRVSVLSFYRQRSPRFLDIIAPLARIELEAEPILEGETVNIEIHDAALEARLRKQLQVTGSGSVEEVLLRLLETQEEQDRWLLENRETIDAKIRRGIDQLERGEGIPEDQLDAYLAKLKNQT